MSTKAETGLRRYGPGKFDLDVDQYVYALTLEGWGDGMGDVGEIGVYYNAVDLGPDALKAIRQMAAEQKDKLTEEEAELILNSAGAVLSEDDQGFVAVEYIDTQKELDARWAKIEEEVTAAYEEGPDA